MHISISQYHFQLYQIIMQIYVRDAIFAQMHKLQIYYKRLNNGSLDVQSELNFFFKVANIGCFILIASEIFHNIIRK
jgi:hypothetical protein